MRILFCLFSEDVGLLKAKEFTQLVENTRREPEAFAPQVSRLFKAMATGDWFGASKISHFNGGLFADDDALPLTKSELDVLYSASQVDWSSVEPTIFGTLFERGLDPSKRSQIGGYYTSRDDILLLVEPVVMAPIRLEWAEIQVRARELIRRRDEATSTRRENNRKQDLQRLLTSFQDKLKKYRILDPACGSGNFLYVALKLLLDLEKELMTSFSGMAGTTIPFPQVDPKQLFGIEKNPYAHELAQVVVWIGYIQWLRDNGFGRPSEPILQPLHNIKLMDAVLERDGNGREVEPPWPDADMIVGNPPFLGGKRLRAQLGNEYLDDLFRLYDGRVPREADLVTYWFERARALIESKKVRRAGLLGTQAIRGGANRRVLERVKQSGDIFYAQADRPWILDGAAVRVSMVGFDDGSERRRLLNESKDDPPELAVERARAVPSIHANLTASTDTTLAHRLKENLNLAFMGDTKGGAFDIPDDLARRMLTAPLNPNGRSNSDVVRPWVNGSDLNGRSRGMWIIDFGTDMSEREAALYEMPFEYVSREVRAFRRESNRKTYRELWWIHMEPRPALRKALKGLARYIDTARVAKHRIFVWLEHPTLPDSATIAFARDDDYFFGVLHSKVHKLWALRQGTALTDRPRYTPTTTFESFPFPWPPGIEPAGDPRVEAIARAAQALVKKRDGWLSPSNASDAELSKRTLTNLYNLRPAWLEMAHRKLDEAVFDSYGWPHALTDDDLLDRLLELNLARANPGKPVGGTLSIDSDPIARRAEDSAPIEHQIAPDTHSALRRPRRRTLAS